VDEHAWTMGRPAKREKGAPKCVLQGKKGNLTKKTGKVSPEQKKKKCEDRLPPRQETPFAYGRRAPSFKKRRKRGEGGSDTGTQKKRRSTLWSTPHVPPLKK